MELFRDERKKEISHNMANIIEGKKAKARKEREERERSNEEDAEDFSIDVETLPTPPIPRKFSLIQLFTGLYSFMKHFDLPSPSYKSLRTAPE